MRYEDLLKKTSDLPCFTARFLAAGEDLSRIRLQLDRWVKNKKPYRKSKPEPFYIANNLKPASYVSLQSALAWYGMIPEYVPEVTSVTTGRPQVIETPIGRFSFRHIKREFFWGYKQAGLSPRQKGFIAQPEKALLDLVYLTPDGDKEEFIEELRLQSLEKINKTVLREFVEKTKNNKLKKAVNYIETIIDRGEGIEL
jgi:predicted transcriptional regulator of viral defense system